MTVALATTTPTDLAAPTSRSSPLDVIFVVLALGFATLGLRPLGDPDVWWHLRTGEMVLKSGFTTSDPWSHASTNPWQLHEWGSEVLMYLSYALGGYRGLIVLHSLGMLVLAVILLRSIRKETAPLPGAIIGFIALVALMPGTAERPQLISWCLLAAVLPALRRSVQHRRPPWWLIPVMCLWANLHGLWAATLVLFGFLVLGLVLEVGIHQWRTYLPFGLVGVASVAAVGLNPNGPALLLAPLHVRTYAVFVSEWQPPALMNPFFGCAYLLVGVLVVGWARRTRPVPASDLALLVGAIFVGLAYIRTIPILVIVVAPLAASSLQHVWKVAGPTPWRQPPFARFLSFVCVVAFIVMALVWVPRVSPITRNAPWGASAELDALPGRARVLNEYVLGGWLLWTARDTSPAIDGRTEIYAPEYVASAMAAPQMAKGWQRFVESNRFDAAWLGKDAPLVFGLKTLGWRVSYKGRYTVIMLPPAR